MSIVGEANTQYTASVLYNSGEVTAGGLGLKTSDLDGNVSWTWKIGGKTSTGTL